MTYSAFVFDFDFEKFTVPMEHQRGGGVVINNSADVVVGDVALVSDQKRCFLSFGVPLISEEFYQVFL